MNSKKKFNAGILPYKVIVPVLIGAILFSYYSLWNTFFFADAWQVLGSYPLANQYGASYIFQLFPMPYGFHFIPLSMLVTTFETVFFGTNILGYTIISLLFHFLNTFLVYLSINRLSKNRFFALLGALTFATNAQIREGVYWFTINTWPEMSTCFILVSLLFFINYFEKKKYLSLIISLVFSLAAVLTMEYAFMIFPMIFVYLLLAAWKEKRKVYLWQSSIPLLFISIYFLFRTLIIHALNPVVLSATQVSHLRIATISIWYLFTLPTKFISAIFIPNDVVLTMTSFISKNIYPDIDIAQTPVYTTVLFFDQLSIFLGILLFILFTYLFFKNRKQYGVQFFSLQIYGATYYLLPLIFLTLSSYLYWIYSRYLYMPAAILSIFIFASLSFFSSMKKISKISITFFILVIVYIGSNAFINNRYFSDFAKTSEYRYAMVQRVSTHFNWQKKHQIIFIKTKDDNYSNGNDIFGVGTSFGKELLVWNWYQGENRKYLSSCLFDPLFLFDSPVNGYKACNGSSYGYYQDINLLNQIVKKYKINKEYIIGLEYDKTNDTLSDITTDIRNRLNK